MIQAPNKKDLLIKCYGFRGSEPQPEKAMKLICETRGVVVLAYQWALKNPVTIVKMLKDVSLHGIEVYKSDKKLEGTQFATQNVAFFLPYVVEFTSPIQHQVSPF